MTTMRIWQFKLSRSFIRRSIYFLRRWARQILAFGIALLFLDLVFILDRSQPLSKAITSTHTKKEKIFVASLQWNNEISIRKHFTPAVLDLVRYFGNNNIYVSIVENGSWDDTKRALTELDLELKKLGVEKTIELRNDTHTDIVNRLPEQTGWIGSPRGRMDLRRIPYLASLRNRAMEKLRELAVREEWPRTFNRVLWINDVIFDRQAVLNLLSTNNGHYAAACSLDFQSPPLFYDTFALRDSSGTPPISERWPYFLSPLSRSAIQAQSPVPVQSCWNGMVAFDATPFYSGSLQFRGLPDSLAEHHLEASECCLIHVDNPLTVEHGVFLNPKVRVAYNADARILVNPLNGNWPSAWEKVQGTWRIRWARFMGSLGRYLERRLIANRLIKWEDGGGTEVYREPGRICIVNEMQILVENGWMHV